MASLWQVLKKYACLWCMKKTAAKRPKLYIVNLQVKSFHLFYVATSFIYAQYIFVHLFYLFILF